MLNFGASKPRVKGGGPGPRGPPWIRTCHEIKNKLVPRSGKALVETKNLHAFPYAVELYFFKPLIIRRPSGTLRVKQWEFQVKLGKNIFTAVRPFRIQDMIHRDLEGPISL